MLKKPSQFFDSHEGWKEALDAWDKKAAQAAKEHPLKVLKHFPAMPGITKETEQHLKWKSFKWMAAKDKDWQIFSHVCKHPFRYLWRYLKSIFSRCPFQREGDFFLYGISSSVEFEHLLQKPNTLLVLGFSYCHKPFECPSGRFTNACMHDVDHPVCKQCFIGKCTHAAPSMATIALYIPTVHYIGHKIFEFMESHPEKEVIFLITACEMTLTMFADWGNMAGIKGVGIRLDGRICNTMRAFELSEEGIKPGLTIVLDETQKQMLEWIRLRRESEIAY